jgi:hypothetical protein
MVELTRETIPSTVIETTAFRRELANTGVVHINDTCIVISTLLEHSKDPI